MAPPEPRWSCTIPSLHDDGTRLDVRIYHPALSSAPQAQNEKAWRKKGIVMAHPYAPMGGSYDDRVVGIVTEEFLAAGWIVGTFNFRGAHGKGHTSWSGKPEVGDYHAVAAFFMHYLSYLHPSQPTDAPIVILGGYSYGSVILRHLPPVLSILQPFAAPPTGSAAHETLRRAHELADQANRESTRRGHGYKLSVTLGGDETTAEQRRGSREANRSAEGGRGLDIGGRLRSLSHGQRRAKNASPQPPAESTTTPTAAPAAIQVSEVRYLLVSPPTQPTATLVAPGLSRWSWNRPTDEDATIKKHTALVIYGDQDMFTSAKKTREWVERIKQVNSSGFSSVKVPGAGHFWFEEGVEKQLRDGLKAWEKVVRE